MRPSRKGSERAYELDAVPYEVCVFRYVRFRSAWCARFPMGAGGQHPHLGLPVCTPGQYKLKVRDGYVTPAALPK